MARGYDDAARQRAANHLQDLVWTLDRLADGGGDGELTLYSVKLKLDADGGLSVLAVLVGSVDGQEVVSFVGAPDLESCLLAMHKRIRAGKLRWRESVPYGE